jgi:adenine-specific DNA-methyltransferase
MLKKENLEADITALEREIDLMVYDLYGLSEEEIGIVENN